MKELILASASPRRKEILDSLGVLFCVNASNFDESSITEKDPIKKCILTARGKAESLFKVLKQGNDYNPQKLILAADTLVFAENTTIPNEKIIFGKPKNKKEAEMMLKSHSGSVHFVVSAICLLDCETGRISEKQNISKVFFKPLSDEEISAYLKTEEWNDAAGGYKIQGKASFFIEKIEGSYTGIVGLPVRELYELLSEKVFINLF
ncbi:MULTISPECIES: Maf family protein [unclassified Treponema]|uniref:Maf family protein n=1 Tax=unclassified Treponema TaxID=2638727 RepID=UPI0020A5B3E6|nr:MULTISPECIES: Maf family protein [unclassified Treponema]UTC67475.1 septum formation protein Maf [Treponema sp. OMZ 789]UTC70203.1 septum formation protein Maf [Treponema sp. OMZ 790]UTC72918.1 septum formation protein Maf [Treponema sp. OMZ 791]